MVVVPAVGGGASAGAGGWGTWEELVLGGAVLRHGGAAWTAVADELRTRCPCTFSPEDCEAKFAEIQSRYSACNAWFEELRKQRVAELKRDLEKAESSIGSLQSVIESLSNSKHGEGSSDCRTTHNESCSHSGNIADTISSGKELSRDRSSAASFTEEASNCQKSQQVQLCDTDSIQTDNPSTESFSKAVEVKAWGSRKQRGRRVRRILQNADVSSRDGEPTSTACTQRDGSSQVCKEDMKKGLHLKASSVELGAAKKGSKTSNTESDAMKKGLKTPTVKPGAMKKGLATPCVDSGVMKKGLKSPKLESGVMKNGLKTPQLECGVMKDGLKTPKLESGVMKNSLKTPKLEPGVKNNLKTLKAESGVSVAEKEKANLAAIVKCISTQGDCLMLQRQVDIQRKRVTYKKMIRRHMDFRIIHSKIKNGTISCTKELLRDMLIFVNNVIAFYPKATLEHMAAVELRDLACKVLNESANIVCKTADAPILKKNAQVTQPGRHGPDDAKGNKVPSRDATACARQGEAKGTATARQGEGKDNSSSDKPPAANSKTVQKSEPVNKRGVGRPPKSGGPAKRSAPVQEDSPSRGRKRLRRGPDARSTP